MLVPDPAALRRRSAGADGVPAVFVWLMAAWFGLIVLMARIAPRRPAAPSRDRGAVAEGMGWIRLRERLPVGVVGDAEIEALGWMGMRVIDGKLISGGPDCGTAGSMAGTKRKSGARQWAGSTACLPTATRNGVARSGFHLCPGARCDRPNWVSRCRA